MSLRNDIETAINLASRENESNTPDHILADYLMCCLEAFEKTSNKREDWYGKHLSILDNE